MATHGEKRWPPVGKLSGRLRGGFHGRRQYAAASFFGAGVAAPGLGSARSFVTARSAWVRAATGTGGIGSAVSCSGARACTVVGMPETQAPPFLPAAYRWNGRTCSFQQLPAPLGFANVYGVSCPSASLCFAVGGADLRIGGSPSFVDRWTGRAWVGENTPTVPNSALVDVSCASTTACTAVGVTLTTNRYEIVDGSQPLVERWNGTNWSIQPVLGLAGGELGSVSCPSRRGCVALGSARSGAVAAERWNGSRWARQRIPSPGYPFIFNMSCSSMTSCMAVGEASGSVDQCLGDGTFPNGGGMTCPAGPGLVWSLHGSRWSLHRSEIYSGVSCVSARWCVATAYHALRLWDGKHWVTKLRLPVEGDAAFDTVSCTSMTACMATGDFGFSQGKSWPAWRWNGKKWSHTPMPVTMPTG